MRIGLRRAPIERDAQCPVCTGLISSATETAFVYDLLSPKLPPTRLVALHVPCLDTLRSTAEDVLKIRANPRGALVDHEGALVIDHGHHPRRVRFRIHGHRRSEIGKYVSDAIGTHGHRVYPDGTPTTVTTIVAHVRRYVANHRQLSDVPIRIVETPAGPESFGNDVTMTVDIYVSDQTRSDIAKAVLACFKYENVPGDTLEDIVAFITASAEAGDNPSTIAAKLRNFPRVKEVNETTFMQPGAVSAKLFVAGSESFPTSSDVLRGYIVVGDPSATRGRRLNVGRFTSSGPPPVGALGSGPVLSPNSGNGIVSQRPDVGAREPAASGCQLPPPGEVADPMLEPLDTPAVLERRRKLIDAYDTIRQLSRPATHHSMTLRSGIVIERDPRTLAEQARFTVRSRLRQSASASASASDVEVVLRALSPLWAAALDEGLSLNVTVDSPDYSPDGRNLDDEVDLRDLLKNIRTAFGTTTVAGKAVAFRAAFWERISRRSDDPTIQRVQARLRELNGGAFSDGELEASRHGILREYDAVTDHALVELRIRGRAVFAHTSLGWTMEDTMPRHDWRRGESA